MEPEGEAPEIEAPLVFLCKNCRTILADSLSFVSSDESSRTMTLQGVTPAVTVDSELCTSKDGRDVGSSFVRFYCNTCKTAVGRVYRATPRDLDELRDRFTFDIDFVSSYQLGTAHDGGRFAASEDMLTVPSLRALEQDILKIKQLVMTFHDRLEEMERHVSPPAASGAAPAPAASAGAGAKRPRPPPG